MKKKLAFGAVIVVAAIVGFLMFGLNPTVKKFSPQIITAISQAAKRPVNFDSAAVSLFPTTGIELSNLNFGKGDANNRASVGKALLRTSLTDLAKGEVAINEVILSDVAIDIRKSSTGEIFIGGLPLPKSSSTSTPSAEPTSSVAKPDTSEKSAPTKQGFDLALNSADFKNISVTFTDETKQPTQSIAIQNLDLSLSGNVTAEAKDLTFRLDGTKSAINLAKLFQKPSGKKLLLTGSVLQDKDGLTTLRGINLTAGESTVGLDGVALPQQKLALKIDPLTLSLGELLELLPQAAGVTLAGTTSGSLTLTNPAEAELATSALPIPNIDGSLSLKALKTQAAIGDKRTDLASDGIKFAFQNDTLTVDESKLSTLGQSVTLSARFESLRKLLGKVSLNSADLDLGALTQALGVAAPAAQGAHINGLALNTAFDGAKKTARIAVAFDQAPNAILPVGKTALDLDASPQGINVLPGTIQLLGGTLQVEGSQGLTENKLGKWVMHGKGLNIEQLPGNTVVSGTVTQLECSANYSMTDLMPSLNGGARFTLGSGMLKGVNVFSQVMKSVSSIPGVEGSLSNHVPEAYRPILAADGTAFDSVEVQSTIARKSITIQTLTLRHSLYVLTGTGVAGLDGSAEMKMQFQLTPLIVGQMLQRQKNLRYLLDKNGNLEIPVIIRKSGTSMVVLPDAAKLLENAARAGAVNAAEKALDKVAPGLGGAAKVLNSLF